MAKQPRGMQGFASRASDGGWDEPHKKKHSVFADIAGACPIRLINRANSMGSTRRLNPRLVLPKANG
jgi:hypothetical protein